MYFVFCFHFKIWCIYVLFVHVQRESMFNASVLLLANDCWVFIFPCYSVRDRLSYSVCADVLTASGLCGLVLKLFGTELILHFIVGLSSTGLFVCQGWIERDCKQWVCSVSDFNIASLSLDGRGWVCFRYLLTVSDCSELLSFVCAPTDWAPTLKYVYIRDCVTDSYQIFIGLPDRDLISCESLGFFPFKVCKRSLNISLLWFRYCLLFLECLTLERVWLHISYVDLRLKI